MHQQVRSSTRRKPASDGPGAMADRGGVVDILEKLREADVNLQAAGGRDLDRGGEFVFSVHHGYHPDGTPDEGPYQDAIDVLDREGYAYQKVDVHTCYVDDEPGGLLGCIRRMQEEGNEPYEIFVGTRDERGLPVQITTRRNVEGGETSQETY